MNERDWRGNKIEQSAFERLLGSDPAFYKRVSKHLAGVAADMGVPPSEIWDVVEEAWMEAVKHRHLFSGDDFKQRLVRWLSKVVRGKAVDALRWLGSHPCEALDSSEEEMLDDAEARRAATVEEREWLDVLLDKVSPGHEESVRLLRAHYFQGLSVRELALEHGMTPDAVDSRIRRVRGRIRETEEKIFLS